VNCNFDIDVHCWYTTFKKIRQSTFLRDAWTDAFLHISTNEEEQELCAVIVKKVTRGKAIKK